MGDRKLEIFLACVILSCAVCCPDYNHNNMPQQKQTGDCSDYVHQVAEIINSFSCQLVSAIGGSGNLFISPFGMSVSLGMIYLGARGTTARQMESVLGYGQTNQSKEEAHDIFHNMLVSLEKSRGGEYSLLAANGIFVQSGFQLLKEYVQELQRHYTAQVKNVNFSDDNLGSMKAINEWTSNHTNGQIKVLLQEPLDPLTELVILNAVYFKGFWKDPFSDQLTHERRFYLADGSSYKRVPFMENKKRVNFFKDDETNYSFLELDYRGDHVSMLFALPKDRVFPVLQIDTDLLCRLRKNFTKTEVAVILPKFTLAYEREMSKDMAKIGLTELFSSDNRALDLTGMRLENDLSVSMMIHKAVIDVNEQGSEASAVSGISFVSRSGGRRYDVFKADHPFLFCILEKKSNTILFMGRVAQF